MATTTRTIFLVRHGEKPPDAGGPPYGIDLQGCQNEHSLIPQGWQRAGALGHLFSPDNPGFLVPDDLFAPAYAGPRAGRPTCAPDHRTYQTIQPLCLLRGLTIQCPYPVGAEQDLAEQLLETGSGVSLVCWEHDHIHDIAAALAPTLKVPKHWPKDRFDMAYRFTDPGTANATFAQLPQMLLAGDSDKPFGL